MSNLVLMRRPGESIVLNEEITITIVEIHGHSQVRVAIEAPPYVSIRRGELAVRPKTGGD